LKHTRMHKLVSACLHVRVHVKHVISNRGMCMPVGLRLKGLSDKISPSLILLFMEPIEGRKKEKRKIYREDNGISERKGSLKKKGQKEKNRYCTVIVIAHISYVIIYFFSWFFAITSHIRDMISIWEAKIIFEFTLYSYSREINLLIIQDHLLLRVLLFVDGPSLQGTLRNSNIIQRLKAVGMSYEWRKKRWWWIHTHTHTHIEENARCLCIMLQEW